MNNRYHESALHHMSSPSLLRATLITVALLLVPAHAVAFTPASPLWPRESPSSTHCGQSALLPCSPYEDPAAGLVWASRPPTPAFSPPAMVPVTPATLPRAAGGGALTGAPYPLPSYSVTAWPGWQPRVLPFGYSPYTPTQRMTSAASSPWPTAGGPYPYPTGVLRPVAPDPLRYSPVHEWGERP